MAFLLMLYTCISLNSCSTVFSDYDDCEMDFQIRFKYDMNMKFADAFANSVSYVALYVYDAQTGKLVLKQEESGDVLRQEDYVMVLDELEPGTYDLLAWCGNGLQEGNFDVPSHSIGSSVKEENICTMDRESGAKVTSDVKQLYHGAARVSFEARYGVQEKVVSLTKNTNTVRVVLQHLSGLDVDPSLFTFEIKDENGVMAHDNTVLDDEVISYYPWSVTAGSAGIDADIYSTRTQTSVSVALAEFTVSRLVTENNPVLSIYNKEEGEKVLSIPLKDYALLVKGNYNKAMSDQEYLDRQDEYNLTFFLDEYGNWASSQIIINSWHIVFQESDL